MGKIKIDDLADTVMERLELYAGITNSYIEESANKAADEAVNYLKENSPKDKGEYAKGWKRDSIKQRKGYMAVVRNKKYRLTHLLEYGHARSGGGRKVPGKAHIKPAEEQAVKLFEDELVKRIEGKV